MSRVGGSLRRRLEIVLGGPARPFPLTVRDADTLASALDAAIERFQAEALRDGGEDRDPEIVEGFRDLRERLYRHAGYGTLR